MSTPPGISIGELAAATGVAPGTLRMWEARHGFPQPARQGTGDRRYSPDDAARVTQVLRERERGLSLPAAIERVRGWSPKVAPTLFAALRAEQPELQPRRLPVPAMLALSQAIEDECLAHAARPILAASFQRERPFRRSEHRWHELARVAALAFVLADFPQRRTPPLGPVEVPLDPDAPAAREWSVVCVDEHFTACLAGWEKPGDDGERAFEAVWSTDPDAVTTTLRAAARLAGPELAGRVEELLAGLSLVGAGTTAATLSLTGRMIGYLAVRA